MRSFDDRSANSPRKVLRDVRNTEGSFGRVSSAGARKRARKIARCIDTTDREQHG
jgi:hypothetical protein